MLRKLAATCVLATMPCAVLAQDATLASDSGDTGWVLTAAALVLLMTLPGLGLFYGGLVRAKNVLSVLLQIGAVAAVASLLWIVAGYTFAFGTSANGLLGIERGWIVARLLNPDRGAIVIGEGLAEMREEPDGSSRVLWRAEPGVVGALGDCDEGWCELDVSGREGWIRAERLWGAGEP